MKKLFATLFLLVFVCNLPTFAKKQKKTFEKLPQTRQEWEQKAKNIDLEKRKIEPYKKEQNENLLPKDEPNRRFVKYNVPPGGAEVDLSAIQKVLDIRSQGVIDPRFKFMAFGEYYYSPLENQISSDIFVLELNSGLTRMKRALDTNILNTKKTPAISSGTERFKKDLFSTLTVVDWSKDSSKLLVKEKLGSSDSGIFQTYLWVYYRQRDLKDCYSKRLTALNRAIIGHFAVRKNIALNNYRWDIRPLGFSANSPNVVISNAVAYDKEKNEIFLGVWGVDVESNAVELISETPLDVPISVNGLVVEEYLP